MGKRKDPRTDTFFVDKFRQEAKRRKAVDKSRYEANMDLASLEPITVKYDLPQSPALDEIQRRLMEYKYLTQALIPDAQNSQYGLQGQIAAADAQRTAMGLQQQMAQMQQQMAQQYTNVMQQAAFVQFKPHSVLLVCPAGDTGRKESHDRT